MAYSTPTVLREFQFGLYVLITCVWEKCNYNTGKLSSADSETLASVPALSFNCYGEFRSSQKIFSFGETSTKLQVQY